MYSCVCVYTCVCVHTCLCLWVKKPEVDVGCLPQSWWHGLSLANMVFQVNCLAASSRGSAVYTSSVGYMLGLYVHVSVKKKKAMVFKNYIYLSLCVYMRMCAHVLVYVPVISMTCTWSSEDSLQVSGVGCLLPASGYQGLNSDHQVWQQSTFTSWANSLALCLTFYVKVVEFELSSLCMCGEN